MSKESKRPNRANRAKKFDRPKSYMRERLMHEQHVSEVEHELMHEWFDLAVEQGLYAATDARIPAVTFANNMLSTDFSFITVLPNDEREAGLYMSFAAQHRILSVSGESFRVAPTVLAISDGSIWVGWHAFRSLGTVPLTPTDLDGYRLGFRAA